jgi:hypothetical protein
LPVFFVKLREVVETAEKVRLDFSVVADIVCRLGVNAL